MSTNEKKYDRQKDLINMESPIKTDAFELFLLGLVEWYSDFNGLKDFPTFNSDNDLSKLKLLKLHFFTCAASNNGKLFEVFDKFYAMPYGHVEMDISVFIDDLKFFNTSNYSLKIKLEKVGELQELKTRFASYFKIVKDSLLDLKNQNSEIITYSSFQLVNLSHNWYSWIEMFELAREGGRYSESIPIDVIKSEKKFFELI